jgi:hypothetical protein
MMGLYLDQEKRVRSNVATLVDVDIICHIMQQGLYYNQAGSTGSTRVMPTFVR